MPRKTKEQLNEIKKKYNVDELWSWSKFHTYKTSKYEYFLKYIIKRSEDINNGAYVAYGSLCHDILEKYYTKQISYKDMIKEFEDGLLLLEMSNLKFDRTSEDKNEAIKQKYLYNLKHFIKNHKAINNKVDIERFILINIGGNIFQGYIDLARKDEEGNFIIQDWKTSTIYKGDKALKEAGQLLLYAEGLIQLGVPINKIKICWNFLKYSEVTITQINGKKNTRQIERIKIGNSLKANCKSWLKKLGYTDIDKYIDELIKTNSIKNLPKEIQEKYDFKDCYVYLDVNKEILNNLKKDIIDTIYEIHNKTNLYNKNLDEKIWFDDYEYIKEHSFYFSNLCGYSANLHKPYKLYLEQYEKEKNGEIFSDINTKNQIKTNNNSNEDEDFEWLKLIN